MSNVLGAILQALRGFGVLSSPIRRGTIALTGVASNTATLSPAVDTTRTFVNFLGFTTDTGSTDRAFCKLVLTNATTLTATKQTATDNATVSYELIPL